MALEINYTPTPTVAAFMASNARFRVLKGPVGSGKSVACCFEIVRRACEQRPNSRGVRKSRAIIIRQTARQLTDTTIKTWLDWFPEGQCGTYMRTTKTYMFRVGDVECEVMFRALDDANDVSNLVSLEATFAWINECRDIAPEIVDNLTKRVGRYPSAKDGGPSWFGVICDTNPPTIDTWWYQQMEHINPEDGVSYNDNGWEVFHQPSGRSAEAENIENLPDGYYDTQGRSDEYIRVMIDGLYGHSLAGTPVFKHFNPDYHISKQNLSFLRGSSKPIVVGIDPGIGGSAAVFGQLDTRGRLMILAEATAQDMGVQRFSRTTLKPLISEKFPGQTLHFVIDPAGVQRAQSDERSSADILRAEGFNLIPARTNLPISRINAVDEFLMRQVDGDAAILLDPRCTRLKAALMGGYKYKKKSEVIDKNEHSHIADALQYLCLHASGIGDIVGRQARVVKPVSSRGWT